MIRNKQSFVIVLGLAVLVSGNLLAQQANQGAAQGQKVTAQQVSDAEIELMRQDLRSQKKQIVAANMTLTDTEAEKFWPLYDKYTQETIKVNDQRFALVKEYAQSYNAMTDAQANSYINRWLTTDKAMTDLRLQWIPMFEKVISAKKTAAFFQIDRRLGLLMEIQLSSQLPLVKP